MATQVMNEQLLEERRSARAVMGGSLAEGVSSLATIVLAIVGLAGFFPQMLPAIATIVMAAAFLLEGGAVTMRYSKLLAETSKDRFDAVEFGTGLTSEFLGGVAGGILGILALLGLYPMILVSVAVIVFGGTLMLSSGLTARLNVLAIEGSEQTTSFKRIANEAMRAAAGVDFLLGLAAIILGIIALTGTLTVTLSLVALLIVGFSGFFTGAAVTTRMASLFRG
jgi:hypothetical protein